MIKQLLSLASIIFVIVCVGAIFAQYVDIPPVWEYLGKLYHLFDKEGNLEIDSTPSGAAVQINNEFVGQTPLKKELSGGTYDIKVMLTGYQTFARRITIEKKDTTFLHAKLSKDYGTLHITSSPTNAMVFIDGKRQGQLTPLEMKVPQGKYFIKIMKDGFYSFDEEVVIEQGKAMTIDANLLRQVGKMIIETTPPGAKAYIGSDLIGTTPFAQDKPVGKYVVTLKKSGFRDKVIEANIAPDESLEITIELTERAGALKVTTNPPGAEVHLNDVYQGESPLRIEAKPGVYRLTINKKQYRDVSEELVIEDNITKNIHRDLDPALGELLVDSDPTHARVWIDSEDMGFTPIKTSRLAGIYTVRIAKPGYKNYVEEITVKEGAFIQLNPALEKDMNTP